MQAHRIHVVVPENHRATIEFPATIPSGPVELIVLVPPRGEIGQQAEAPPQGRGRLAALGLPNWPKTRDPFERWLRKNVERG